MVNADVVVAVVIAEAIVVTDVAKAAAIAINLRYPPKQMAEVLRLPPFVYFNTK